MDGNFSLNVASNATLIVSYIGYKTVEVKVENSPLKIELQEDSKVLSEVVVTALGIKRERKALGYGVDEVKGDALTKAKETNVINSMAGRVPGLVVSQTAGGASGSTRVILRGSTEMTGNNQPLYVIDGVPWTTPIMEVPVMPEALIWEMVFLVSIPMILRICRYLKVLLLRLCMVAVPVMV